MACEVKARKGQKDRKRVRNFLNEDKKEKKGERGREYTEKSKPLRLKLRDQNLSFNNANLLHYGEKIGPTRFEVHKITSKNRAQIIQTQRKAPG